MTAFVACLTIAWLNDGIFHESIASENWISKHHAHNPLVGKIWSSKKQTFVTLDTLKADLAKARFVLLGETHTNKDHHRLQAQMLEIVARHGKVPPRVTFEMIPARHQATLDRFGKLHPNDTTLLGEALEWKKRGWGDWENYKAIFDVAYKYKATITAGNLDKKQVRKIGRQGKKSLDASETKGLLLDIAYTKGQSELLNDMLFESHCKFVPRKALSPMKLVQQARDGRMASQMLAAAPGMKSVLIAGSGHVRRDWAVPRLLKIKQPKAKIVSISFVEVTGDDKLPHEYEPQSADKSRVFDYLYFTPRSEIKDHCADLAKRFKKHKRK